MQKFLGIVIIFLSIVLIYQYIQLHETIPSPETPLPEPFYSNNRNTRTSYGIPVSSFISPDKVYMSTISNGSMVVIIDEGGKLTPSQVDTKGKKVASWTSSGGVKFVDFSFNPNNGDILYIYNYNPDKGTKTKRTYWAGHIYYNKKFYPTNSSNFRIVGIENRSSGKTYSSKLGKNGPFTEGLERIGCYKDGGSRRLPIHHYPGRYFTLEDCWEIAYKHGSEYFGVQYGGQCFSGNDLERATSYGTRQSNTYCGWNSWNSADRTKDFYRTGGNSWTNDIHTVFSGSPTIRYFGSYGGRWPAVQRFARSDGKGIAKFDSDTYAIQPYVGGEELDANRAKMGHNVTGRWVQYVWDLSISKYASFCADNTFVEHNPTGCSNPENSDYCESSVNSGWVSDNKLCVTPLTIKRYSYNDYDNIDFFKIVNDFFYSAFNTSSELYQKTKSECVSVLKDADGDLVKSLRYSADVTNKKAADDECCELCLKEPSCQFWTRDKKGNCYLKKNFKGYKDSTEIYFAFRASATDQLTIIKQLLGKAGGKLERCVDIACSMIKNLDSKYDVKMCMETAMNSFNSGSSSGAADVVVKTITKAMKISATRMNINGKDPNAVPKKHLEDELLEFVKVAKAFIVKSSAALTNCKCTSGSADCAPC